MLSLNELLDVNPQPEFRRLSILDISQPALRMKCKPVATVDKELRDAVRQMFELMYTHVGVGLAACQVGLLQRFFIMNVTGKKGDGIEEVFVNPTLSKFSGSASLEEGCLSQVGIKALVQRPAVCWIDAWDLHGNKISRELGGMSARIAQHEVDHLDGRLFTDRLSVSQQIRVKAQMKSLEDKRYESRILEQSVPASPSVALHSQVAAHALGLLGNIGVRDAE